MKLQLNSSINTCKYILYTCAYTHTLVHKQAPVLQSSLLSLSWHSLAPVGLRARHTGQTPEPTLCEREGVGDGRHEGGGCSRDNDGERGQERGRGRKKRKNGEKREWRKRGEKGGVIITKTGDDADDHVTSRL